MFDLLLTTDNISGRNIRIFEYPIMIDCVKVEEKNQNTHS